MSWAPSTHPEGSGSRVITTVIVAGIPSTTACTLPPKLVQVSVRRIVKPSGRTERREDGNASPGIAWCSTTMTPLSSCSRHTSSAPGPPTARSLSRR